MVMRGEESDVVTFERGGKLTVKRAEETVLVVE